MRFRRGASRARAPREVRGEVWPGEVWPDVRRRARQAPGSGLVRRSRCSATAGLARPRVEASPRAAGFTLLEIIVTLVIAGMAAALVAPAIEAGLRQRQVRSGLRMVIGAVRRLESDALRTGRAQDLVVDPFENALVVPARDVRIELPPAARMRDVDGGLAEPNGAARVRFFPNGSNTGLSLRIGDPEEPPEEAFALRLDPLIGVVSVRDPSS